MLVSESIIELLHSEIIIGKVHNSKKKKKKKESARVTGILKSDSLYRIRNQQHCQRRLCPSAYLELRPKKQLQWSLKLEGNNYLHFTQELYMATVSCALLVSYIFVHEILTLDLAMRIIKGL